MTQAGDSHGWHWDDYTYSMVWVVDAPADPADGGGLEFVPNTTWDKDQPRIDWHLSNNEILSGPVAPGMAYLLRADTALHRVAPLRREGLVRTVLVYTYGSLDDLTREVTHETMEDVYPEEYT